MAFATIHTTYGLQRMAAAEASGIPINLTHMAVGDGNGNNTSPIEGQTALVGEKYRFTVNRVFQDPDNPKKFTAELVVPATVGGFTMREVGIFDVDGGLFAVGNLPTTYKPNISEGAYSDSVVRLEFLVSNAGIITIQVDPNVVVATRTWIQNNITAAALFPGGTTNQVLAKNSNADGDTKWMDLGAINVTVDVVEERQALAAAQTTVTLALTTTRGLAVYIEGVRLNKGAGADEWAIAGGGVSLTQIVLGKAYPDATAILLVQNEPAGSASAPLEIDQNLADVADKAVGRTNLGVYSKAEVDQRTPPSAIMHFPRATAPTGWLKANGAAISRTAYAALYAVIGTTYGAGDGFTTFALPDLRGEFIRGWDDSRGADPGRAIGTAQSSQNLSHVHSASTSTDGGHFHEYVDTDTNPAPPGLGGLMGGADWWDRNSTALTSNAGAHTHDVNMLASGGNESRPRNIALLACIKF